MLIHNILRHSESGSTDLLKGIGLCIALFLAELTKAIFWALTWAINYRTAMRLKVAVSTVAFENLLAFKTLSHISVGEVSGQKRCPPCPSWLVGGFQCLILIWGNVFKKEILTLCLRSCKAKLDWCEIIRIFSLCFSSSNWEHQVWWEGPRGEWIPNTFQLMPLPWFYSLFHDLYSPFLPTKAAVFSMGGKRQAQPVFFLPCCEWQPGSMEEAWEESAKSFFL